ncbi:citrate/2-methylcitrate synthase [Alicyclobacillus fodiniaquatilis]|jgi:citrate synthase|uniref:Citrate synthase n=1 Tax=Alicyclobacillus fodiniaquatilis TaxID=1661150 RepID=A0ABW4JNT8_9BACL
MAWVNGLQDVVAAKTAISDIDGEHGLLSYRGTAIANLVGNTSYEDVAHLLWTGNLPTESERQATLAAFQAGRQLNADVMDMMDHLPHALHPMDAATIGLLAASSDDAANTVETAIRMAAAFPVLLLRHHANQQGRVRVAPRVDLGQAANFLYMLHGGKEPLPEAVAALEAYLILTMEHSLNASTFAGRVAASTRASMPRALAASLMTMTGPLHGGAPSKVMDMFDAIQTPARAETWLHDQLAKGARIMGFGHRVYRTVDPRAHVLKQIAIDALAGEASLALALTVEAKAQALLAALKPGRRLYANVEYWAACVLRTLDIPRALYTATFASSRIVGWTAHILEQYACDTLIRPQAIYAP